jgi:hypothetical protein
MPFFTRQYIVDPLGSGTGIYPTIQAAINAAVTAGANGTTGIYWQVLVAPGTYAENVVFPTTGGISLNGTGALTIIQGTVDMYPACQLSDLYIDLRVNTAAAKYALGLRAVGSSYNSYISNVVIYNWLDGNFTLAAIECSGSATPIFRMSGGFVYAANRVTGSNPLAKVVAVRLMSDFVNAVEILSPLKTSAGTNGVAESVCVLNHQVGGVGVPFGYAKVVAPWDANYAGLPISGGGTTPPAVLVDSVNTTHPGFEGHAPCWNPAGTLPIIRSAYAGTPTSINAGIMGYNQISHRIAVEANAERWDDGDEFGINPVYRLDHTPTGADPAPEGAVAVVAP